MLSHQGMNFEAGPAQEIPGLPEPEEVDCFGCHHCICNSPLGRSCRGLSCRGAGSGYPRASRGYPDY